MKLLAEQFKPAQQYVFHDMDWPGYEKILNAVGEKRFRHTYAEGVLEIMSPSYAHESYKEFITQLILTLTEELGMEVRSAGAVRMKPALSKYAIEADAAFFIANEAAMRGKRTWELGRDPAPDLAVEIEVTNSCLSRMPIYALLGIPELWRYDGEKLVFEQLNASGHYEVVVESLSFPKLVAQDILPFIEEFAERGQNQIIKSFRHWIQVQFADR